MDCLFLRDSRSPLSPETRNHFLPAARIAMLLLGAFLTMSQANTAFATPGCTIVGACNYDPDATSNDGSCDFTSCLLFGCTNPSACNFDPDADYSDGSCEYVSCAGCMNEAACDYDPEATLAATCTDFSSCYGCTDATAPNFDPSATLDDGSCEVVGCTIVGACNFDPDANTDDGSCDFFSCLPSGCLNQGACNYDPAAIINDGSCEFPESGYDCDGNCLADTDGDGVCDANEVEGCTDSDALNYDADATDDDGSCIATIEGCQDPTACNYNPLANVGDDSCEFTSCAGCLSASACNYDPTAVYPATCEFPEAGYDCDGICLVDNDGDGVCDPFEIPGCTNPEACNYDEGATELDGSCDFDTCAGCTNPFGCNYDPNATIDDGSCDYFSCITFGCTNEAACNYDAEATYEDGSCEFTTCAGCTNPLACDYDPEATISAQCLDFTSCVGCTDPDADNYDPEATQDNGNCLFLGCTVSVACNYEATANSDDGSCEYESCAGCLNPIACNYDPDAVLSGDCEFAENGYDCDGNCLADTDGDGICDPFEVLGCTNPEAVNFDSDATDDDGSCFILTEGCIDPSACNYDENANTDDGSCEFTSCAGCLNENACNYDPTAVYPAACEFPEYAYNCDGSCIADNDGDGICNPFEVPGCTAADACNYDPEATDDDGSCDFITCNVPGCTNPFACNYDPEAVINDGSCDFLSCLAFGCTNPSACNYDPDATYNDGSCEYSTCAGCTNPLACDYDPDATIAAGCMDYSSCYGCTDTGASNFDADATFDDGTCQFPGCTVEGACNYDPSANFNDGSCDFFSCLVEGCLVETACNYDPEAQLPGECTYPEAGYDCDGNCLVDTDGDGVCDPFEISGCTDPNALNFDAEATEDNGSCILPVEGCTDSSACNYDVTANVDDGSCEFESCVGCLAPFACNYEENAIYPGECEYPESGYDCDGNCLSDFDGDGVCDPFEVLGCDDPNSINYDPNATQDDGSCIPVVEGCTNADACNYNADANVDDGSCDFDSCVGCLSPTACNYDPDATVAGECIFPELGYGCDGECLEDTDGDGVCDLFEVAGCTDPEACNYDPEATDDNDSCYTALDGYDCEGNCLSDQDNDGICDPFELPPVLTLPADTLAECGSDLPAATATGGCSEPVITFEDNIIPGNCDGNYTVLRTWTASDNCGNSTSKTQTIIFQDTTAPVVTAPEDFTVECSEDILLEEATATDVCSSFTIEETSVTTPGDAAGNYTIVRTFTATDDCGNSSSATQTITVQDTTAPEFTFVPADYTVECSDEMPMDDATASDNCGEVTIEVSSETTAGDAAGNYTITRTFTATDDAGNSSSATQTITVQDTTAPEFTFVPADYTVECSDEMPMDDATASDNCGEVTIEVSSETTAGDAAGNYTITRTFTATDDAGNSTSATQTITVQDTTAPEFTFVPADYTVECSDEMPMDDATASDNCGEVTIEVSSETTAGDAAGNYVIVRTFTATDDAGNSTSATQTITVQDTTAPEFTFVPADYTVECSDEMPMDDATASDNCGEVTIEVSSETTAGDAAGNYTITRTFTATDDAGNSSSATQTITVQDTTAPEFTFVPADYTVECSDEMPMDDATASDNCGEVTIEVSSETTAGDAAGNYTIVRTFTATDDAGNSSSATQTITVQDTTAPEFTFVPADYTVECSDEMPMDDATASDNCGEVTIEVSSETTAGDAAGNYTIVRTFTATDDAGNSSSATQTITVQDTTAPEFTFVPADYTVECSDEMPMDDATASDNCGEVTIEVSSETTAGDAAGNYTITRTFTATDDAGNSTSATQTITVQDTTAPEFTFVPADYTVECSDEMPMDDATASDNCGEVTIEVSSETTAGDAAGNYTIVRTFTATDDAGNSSSATQTITVQDTTAPEFTFVPADYTVECSDEMPMDDATASDNCGEVTIEVSSETTAGDAAGNYTITRTFTATDDAGNSTSATQTITVQDTTAPEFTFVPADYTVECSDEMPMDDATASDNCGEVTIEVSSETTAGDAAGNYVIVRTFTATDDAGNSTSATQTITVQDTTAPEFTFVPADYTVECSDEMPMDDATASDNCGEVTIEVSSETTAGDAAGNYVIVRTFTATDDAGNSSSATQTITVQDTTAPEFTFVPADYTVECSDEMPMDDATASDNCGEVTIEVSSETTAGDAAGNYTIVRTFTATDDAGNSSSATQTITVQDTTAPEFTFVPADYTVECSDEMPMDDATASDNCGEVTIEVSSETTAGDAAGNYTITRTFTATDDAGNSSSATQTITVQDTTAPEFTFVPADYTVECSDEMPMDDATASDNCGEVTIEVSSETTAGDAAGNYVIVRTFTATDDAGNSTSATQTITVQDTTAPEFIFVPADYTVECSDEMPMDDATASDNCGEVTIEVSSETTAGDAAGNYTIVRTFTATDDAGNSSSATQTITVQDTTAPEFTFVPADYTVECSDEMPMDDATASDNCGEVTIEVSSETTAGDAAGNYTIVRTFTATDDAGNSSSATQTITVQDTTAPEFIFVPADYTVECSDEMPMDDATASDNCGEVTIEVSSETTAGDAAGNYTITRTFTATDDAGNSSSATQTITVQDTTAPEFTFVPADYTVECSDEMPMDDATASDNCGEVTIEVSSETTAGDAAGNYTIVRTFTATDDAGNSSSATQTITVQDTTAPEFTFVPADYTVECSDEMPMDDATASDNCGEVTIEVSSETTAGDAAGNYTIVRTFTATDDAGNSSSATQTITVQDTTAPEFTFVPADYTVECSDEMPMDDATASDNCGEVTIEVSSETTAGDAAGNYTITRTFTATDDAGNSTSATQTITVQDTTAPEFTFVPADYTVECSDEMPMDDATASDNCGEVTIEVSSETTAGDAAGNYTIVRTFTATDDAGNSSSATQTITVQDTTAPEFTFVPADYTVECSDEMPMDDATASDNCGEVTIEVSSETTAGDAAGNYTITRTFTATDDAGNSTSATQTITVQDTTAPEFTFVPADYTVECSDEMPMDDATASDNCGEVTIEVSSETTAGDAAGNYVIVRTFTATDDAGNSSSATQTITVQDTTAPEFTFVPADYTVECSDEMPMDDATASDNCGEVTIEVSSETTAGDAAGNYTITRTFTATDDAGNSTSATQTITVQDTTAPEFTFVPADYTVECSDEMPMDDATASDNCGEVTIEVSSETTAGDAAGNYVIVRTFTATDDAGNSSSATQTITVQDTTAPEFTFVPADYTVECSDEMPMDDATASDNCGEVTIEVSSETTAGDAAGNYTIVRTFTATDDAGNSSSATQTITVQDTTAPEFTFVPEGFEVSCSSELPTDYEMATATDSCGDVNVTLTLEEVPGETEGAYTLQLIYTATDDAGNAATAVVEVEVGDTVPEGDCDCDGNQLDAIGVCGGDCLVDSDGDGICDLFEVFGCTDEEACNYDPEATQNDGSCTYPDTGYDCDGECLEDINENGICDIFEVSGCTDPSNPGYNPNATVEDGSCLVGGCLVPSACNYTSEADYQILGFCDFTSCAGCTDAEACNYDADATQDDGSCDFAEEGFDCDGVCLNDADGDGVCDEDEVAGCTDPNNPGYNPFATDDDGSCLVGGCALSFACNYDPTVDYLIFGDCDFESCTGCTNEEACNYDADATLDDNSCEFPDTGLDCDGVCLNDADGDGICDEDEIAGCTDPTNPGYNPNATDDDGSCLVSGCVIVGACNYDPNADVLDITLCDFTSCQGCTDVTACNYDADATVSNNTDCTYPASAFADCDGNCVNDADGDGVCDEEEVFGCTDEDASNYNPMATEDNGTCDFAELGGCTLPFACNYDPEADFYLPGSCDFESCFSFINDDTCNNPFACNFEEEGECDFVSCLVLGCTNPGACNFDPEANTNDGSCEYMTCIGCTNPNACDFDPEALIAGVCYDYTSCVGCLDESADNYDPEATEEGVCLFDGCTIPGACNYDADANNNDGSCDFYSCIGCQNEDACNYDEDALYPGSCTYPAAGLDCDGNCLDSDEDDVCDNDEVEGCTDEDALNYDDDATEDDDSCEDAIPGCTNYVACNYDMEANTDDGSCEFDSCAGCLSAAACNYNGDAIYPGPCEFPEMGYDCEGNCLNDQDGDGICDADEVAGCTDASAVNYDAEATDDDGSCEAAVDGCTDMTACNYDDTANVDDGSCEFESCAGCLSPAACNFDPTAIYPGDCEFAEEGYDCDGICIADECGGCTVSVACNYNPEATFDDGSCEFTSCLPFGCTDASACNYDPDALFEDGSCEYADFPYDCDGNCLNDDDGDGVCDEFEVFGCTDEGACNYSEGATNDDGSCTYDCVGCTSPAACNYDPDATIDDGSCDFTSCIVFGCTDANACNYDPEAELNDGSCDYLSCAGCTDASACNYDETATIENGSCVYPEIGYDCDGNCLFDADGDGVCDEFEVEGCTSNCACNFDPTATDDDDSCVFEGCNGCVYDIAMNYDPTAVFDDGSCIFQGCMDETYSNYDPNATFEGEGDCSNEPANADFNNDGIVQLADLLTFLMAYGTEGPNWGFQDWILSACEVAAIPDEDLLATVDVCEGEDCCGNEGCSYAWAMNYDPNADVDSGVCLFPGCTDDDAVNFDPLANVDNGTCSYQPCPDFNGDGLVQIVDLMDLLLVWGTEYD